MTGKNKASREITATKKAFDIVETIVELDGAGVSDIAAEVEMSKSTVHAHLASLISCGYVVKENETYELSLAFLNLGTYARNNLDIFKFVKPKVDELAEDTDYRAQYMIEQHGHAIHVYRAVGDNTVPTNARIGKPRYLHTTAAGKAILASLPAEKVEHIIEQTNLQPATENSITDKEELYEELEAVRERGYAFNIRESIQNVSAVGAPINPDAETQMGAISISGPSYRMEKDNYIHEELPDILLSAIEEIELNIEYS